jgi:hypothetical protein
VLLGQLEGDDTGRLLNVVRGRFAPGEIVALIDPSRIATAETAIASSLIEGKTMMDGKATAYVCSGYACHQPVTDPDELQRLLKNRD